MSARLASGTGRAEATGHREKFHEAESGRAKDRQAKAGEQNLPNEDTSSGKVSKTSDEDGSAPARPARV